MNLFVAIVLLGIFMLLIVGAVMAVVSTLGKRHQNTRGSGSKHGGHHKSRSR